jgi:hypothetical protein
MPCRSAPKPVLGRAGPANGGAQRSSAMQPDQNGKVDRLTVLEKKMIRNETVDADADIIDTA